MRNYARENRAEAALLGLFALFSLVPYVVLFAPGSEGVFNGTEGLQVDDQMQYLAFIRDAGENVLQSNRYDVVSDPHLFLHPMFALSGLLWALGASVQLAFLVWKPVAVVAVLAGFTAYVHGVFEGSRRARLAALALALFYFAPAAALAEWLGASEHLRFGTLVVALEPYAAAYPWGGFPGAVAVACMPLFLLGIERVLDAGKRRPGRSERWYAVWAGVAGLAASWLHPWQGIVLLAIVAGLVVWDRFDRRYLALVVPVGLTALPLAYFFVLSQTDSSWAHASRANDFEHVGLWLVLGFLPALFALTGIRGRDLALQGRILLIWPAAAFVVYFALQQSWFYHAFAGLTLPLAVLAVRGWQRFVPGHPVLATAVVLALTLPGAVFMVLELRETRADHFLASGERRALSYLDASDRRGAVLAPQAPLGRAVPGFTGRRTYVGNYYWTPDYDNRRARTELLFSGGMDRSAARALLSESRAAFLASDCGHSVDLAPLVRPWLLRVRRFGCATVYELRPGSLQAQITPASWLRSAAPTS